MASDDEVEEVEHIHDLLEELLSLTLVILVLADVILMLLRSTFTRLHSLHYSVMNVDKYMKCLRCCMALGILSLGPDP